MNYSDETISEQSNNLEGKTGSLMTLKKEVTCKIVVEGDLTDKNFSLFNNCTMPFPIDESIPKPKRKRRKPQKYLNDYENEIESKFDISNEHSEEKINKADQSAKKMKVSNKNKSKQCDMCLKVFSNKQILKDHIVAVHYKLKPYKCDKCDHAYGHPRSLYRHKLVHTNERPHQCEDCGAAFRDVSHYHRHRDIHLNNKNYFCDVCGVSFRRLHHLNQHMHRHTGAKPLQCEVCTYSCRQSSQLLAHRRRHHTHDFPYICQFCNKGCVSLSEARNHQRRCKNIQKTPGSQAVIYEISENSNNFEDEVDLLHIDNNGDKIDSNNLKIKILSPRKVGLKNGVIFDISEPKKAFATKD